MKKTGRNKFSALLFSCILLIAFFSVGFLSGSVYAATGLGTEASPYIIDSAATLNSTEMRNLLGQQNKYFKITNNINLGEYNWTPIPSLGAGSVLDGGGNKINGLNIVATNSSNNERSYGLFAEVKGNTTLKNFEIECGQDLKLSNTGTGYDGLWRSFGINTEYNINIYRHESGSYYLFVKDVDGNPRWFIDSAPDRNISVPSNAIAYSDPMSGKMPPSNFYSGTGGSGFSGGQWDETEAGISVSNLGTGTSAAGLLFGKTTGSGSVNIENIIVNGKISGLGGAAVIAGGIGGFSDEGITLKVINSNSVAYIGVSGSSSYNAVAGGLIGYSRGTLIISDSYNEGSVNLSGQTALSAAGGLVGYLASNGSESYIQESFNNGNINITTDSTEDIYAGGLVGLNEGGLTISRSYNSRNVTGTRLSYTGLLGLGGLVGKGNATIIYSYNQGSITAMGDSGLPYLGGLIGYGGGDFRYSYNIGELVSNHFYIEEGAWLAGLTAYAESVNVDSCYSSGSVFVFEGMEANIGGLLGTINVEANIKNSYSTTEISTPGGNLGGLAAYIEAGNIFNSYYAIDVSGAPSDTIYSHGQGGVSASYIVSNGDIPDSSSSNIEDTKWSSDNMKTNNFKEVLNRFTDLGTEGYGYGQNSGKNNEYPYITEYFIVTWYGWDEEVYEKGIAPSYKGTIPTKASTAQYNFTFAGWSSTEGGGVIETLPNVTKATTYYAVYNNLIRSYTVVFGSDTSAKVNGSSITSGNLVEYGKTVVLTYIGTPETGKQHKSWNVSGSIIAGNSFTVVGLTEVTAIFEWIDYTITFNSDVKAYLNGSLDSEIASGTILHYGQTVKVVYNGDPGTGKEFKNWTITGVLEENEGIFTVNLSNINVTANIGWIWYTLTFVDADVLAKIEGVRVYSNAQVHYGQEVEIAYIGTPEAGKEFRGWIVTGADIDENIITVDLFNITILANTDWEDFTITFPSDKVSAIIVGVGPIASGASVTYEQVIELSYIGTPGDGKEFKNWVLTGTASLTGNQLKFIASSIDIEVNIGWIIYHLTFAADVTAKVDGSSVSSGAIVHYGQSVVVSYIGTPGTGKEFKNWNATGGVTVAQGETIKIGIFTVELSSVHVEANIDWIVFYITFESGIEVTADGLPVESGGIVHYNQDVTISYVGPAPTGRKFTSWAVTGATPLSNELTTVLKVGLTNISISVNTEWIIYYLTFETDVIVKVDGSSVSSGAEVNYGQTVELEYIGTIETGKEFKNWNATGGVTVNETNGTFTVEVSDIHVSANINWIIYHITFEADVTVTVDSLPVESGDIIHYNQAVVITYIGPTGIGKEFKSWIVTGATPASNEETTELTVDLADITITANVDWIIYYITFGADVSVKVDSESVSTGAVVHYGQTVELEWIVQTGRDFYNWVVTGADEFENRITIGLSNVNVEANTGWTVYYITFGSGINVKVDSESISSGAVVHYGQLVELVYVGPPAQGKEYLGWIVTGATEQNDSFTVETSNITVTANVDWIKYKITFDADIIVRVGAQTLSSGATVYFNQLVELFPGTGKEFTSLSVTGATLLGTMFVVDSSDIHISATVSWIEYSLTFNPSTISVKVNNVPVLTSGAKVTYGQTVEIEYIGTPGDGKEFKSWTVTGGVTVTNGSFTVKTSNISITANTGWIDYTITFEEDITVEVDGTQIISGSTVHYSQVVVINYTGTPETGKKFESWAVTGASLTGNTFTVETSNITIAANIVWIEYTLTFDSNIIVKVDEVTVSSGAKVHYGQLVKLEWIPEEGKGFISWNVTGASVVGNTLTVDLEDITITANIGDADYIITFDSDVVAKVNGTEIDSGDMVCYGQLVELTYIGNAGTGMEFKSWNVTGGVTVVDNTFIVGTSNITISANTGLVDYIITFTSNISVKVDGVSISSGDTANYGQTVVIEWISEAGKEFDSFEVTGASLTGNIFTVETSNITISVNTNWTEYTLTLASGISATVDGETVVSGAKVHYGQVVVLSYTGNAGTGMEFKSWNVTGAELSNDTFTVGLTNITVSANTGLVNYTITFGAGITVTVDGTQIASGDTANYNQVVVINYTGTPETGKVFKNWEVTGAVLSGNTFTVGTSNIAIAANIGWIEYTITFGADTAVKVDTNTVTSGANVHYGQSVEINYIGTLETGKGFKSWTVTGAELSGNTLTVGLSNITITANTGWIDYSITVIGGQASVSTAHYGEVITITATVPSGYVFSGWLISSGTITNVNNAETTFTMPNSSVTVTAVLKEVLNITHGEAGEWTEESTEEFSIRIDAEISTFEGVKINGVLVDPSNYTVTEGSTIITFKPEFLETLGEGDYEIEFLFDGGVATTTLKIKAAESNPQTPSGPETWVIILIAVGAVVILGGGIVVVVIKKKRKNSQDI